jgi:predicted transcriptional regulator
MYSVKPKLSDTQKEVYEAARMMNRPFTDKQLADFMNWEINCITPRRGELVKKGLIRDSGKVDMSKGRPATLWEIGTII